MVNIALIEMKLMKTDFVSCSLRLIRKKIDLWYDPDENGYLVYRL